MSRLRLLGLPALLAGAILVAPTGGAGAAVTVGISDQQAQTFADARLRSLGLRSDRCPGAPCTTLTRRNHDMTPTPSPSHPPPHAPLILLLARLRPGLAQLLRPPPPPDMRGQS